ncbi:hypothetical protein HYC85_012004 [Camellia sinensis]|uniref:Cyclin N-terminal domain-containing protein n=1 Tax=Camellia sinensis TaxID=4442 RepID=A0A7J7HCQ5_CAMSI|nr:hypothetical protein HYC85_012004 [Camellia sinensis]
MGDVLRGLGEDRGCTSKPDIYFYWAVAHPIWEYHFQGVTKYEKINHPLVDEFCYLTDNAYTKKEVVKMEADILKHPKFEVGGHTIMTFLGKVIAVAQEDYQGSGLKVEK